MNDTLNTINRYMHSKYSFKVVDTPIRTGRIMIDKKQLSFKLHRIHARTPDNKMIRVSYSDYKDQPRKTKWIKFGSAVSIILDPKHKLYLW